MYKWEIFASAEAKTVEGSSGAALWDNVANLRILPGMGKIVLSAGSPNGAPVESKSHPTGQPETGCINICNPGDYATRYRG